MTPEQEKFIEENVKIKGDVVGADDRWEKQVQWIITQIIQFFLNLEKPNIITQWSIRMHSRMMNFYFMVIHSFLYIYFATIDSCLIV